MLRDETQTRLLGEACGRVATPGLVIALRGGVGVGKTTFVSGLSQGLGSPDRAKSPTFTLIEEHTGGRLPLYHIDLYRLGDDAGKELDLLDEYWFGEGVCAVEWAQLLEDALPDGRIDLHLVETAESGDVLDTAVEGTEEARDGAGRRELGGSGRTAILSARGDAAVRTLQEWMTLWPC
ncbi:MAG: tRNA (adenosine(37)-N6)-threonylcarbamoyltransferase complex ATPase subunit type 1 TsaE [Bacilli bacterium]